MQAHNGTTAISYALQPFGGSIGIGSFPHSSLKLDVAGNVGASNYCNGTGGDCTTAALIKRSVITKTQYTPNHATYGNQMSSRAVSTPLNISGEVTFYSASQETAVYLCKTKMSMPFGTWRSVAEPSSTGWQPYGNLAIAAYDPTSPGSRAELCVSGSACYSNSFHYGTVLDCWGSPAFSTPGAIPSIN